MSKTILETVKAIGLAFGIFILSQLAILPIFAVVVQNLSFTPVVIALLVAIVILINGFLLFIAYKLDWLAWKREGVKGKDFLWIFLSYPMIYLGAMVGAYILQQQGGTTTTNQETLNEAMQHLPKLLIFLIAVINAPIGEELLCREAVPRLFSERYRKIGFVLGAILFTLLHKPTDFGSWVIYGSMSAAITWFRYRTGKVEIAIGAHMLWNFVSFLLTYVLNIVG